MSSWVKRILAALAGHKRGVKSILYAAPAAVCIRPDFRAYCAYRSPTAVRKNKNMNYQDYLKSTYWKQRRYAALERVEFRCQLCGESDSLEVHHLSYERLGNEDPADLFVICKSHHWMQHNPPIINPAPARCEKGEYLFNKLQSQMQGKTRRKYYKSARNNFRMHKKHCPICKKVPNPPITYPTPS